MAITRRHGGISGKECATCKEWKPFADYTMERKPGGNMKVAPASCTKCTYLAKAAAKKKLHQSRP
jgi:hypothetical protein